MSPPDQFVMSLRPTPRGEVPAATAAVARAAFPKGNRCLDLRDALGPIFNDEQFGGLFAVCGQPAECPWRLALVTLLQFGEDLSDRRAAEAVRGRIDWRYLLGLELADPGFDASVLSEFRARLVAGGAETLLFDTLLELCQEHGLLRKRGRQRDVLHPRARRRAVSQPPRLRRRDAARGDGRARGRSPQLASRPRPVRPGWVATPGARTTSTCRGARPRGEPSPNGSGMTGMLCSPPSWPPTPPPGCARCPPPRCCAGCGCRPSSSTRDTERLPRRTAAWSAGGPRPRASRPRCSWWPRPTTRMCTTAQEAGDDRVDRLQGSSERDLQRRAAAADHTCRHDPRSHRGPRRPRPRPRGAGGEGSPAQPSSRGCRLPRRPVSSWPAPAITASRWSVPS